MLSWAEKFLKNLPLAPLAPPPKLGRVPSSFAIGGAFVKSILPPFRPLRPFCPRRDRLRMSWMPDQDLSWYLPLSVSGRVCYQSANPCAKVPMYPCSCQGVMRAGSCVSFVAGAGETPALPGWYLLTWAGLKPVPRIVVRGRLYDSPPLSLGSRRSLMASPNMFRL